MGINYQTIKFKEEMTNLINNSGLPAINVLFVLDSLKAEVSNLCNQAIEKEKEEYIKNEQENEKHNIP
jgi:hypothetical protein